MSDIIHLLPDSVANQIAAGEVIQRPASVVKELVENAIDASAREIHVLVTDAGKTNIQVIDDGKGMSETDARLSFERHATSKIKNAADLFALHTMGFRGEALASIAAVAEVELKTRTAGEDLGTRIVISGSKLEAQEVVSCPKGSNFSIKNLFFNVPARRKFLKANSTELRNICDEFQRIALVNPDVAFHLYSNDAELFNLPAMPLRQRIMGIFGKKLNKDLLSVEVDTTLVKISGYVGKPETSRKNGVHQYFFVNGRYMYHPYFRKAVMEAFDKLIPVGEQISYFIYFEVDPANIDVNIHPTKTEIKFENEQGIWQILFAAVKESLGRFNAVPSIDFDTEDMPDIPAFEQSAAVKPPTVHYNPAFNPFDNYEERTTKHNGATVAALYESLLPDVVEEKHEHPTLPYAEEPAVTTGEQYLTYKGRYILTSVKSGLMLIDQHRAHIRVLFEQFREQIRGRKGVAQGVLFPEIVQFTMGEAATVDQLTEEFSAVGFELTPLGNGSYAINGVPSEIEGLNPVELVRNMLHAAIEKDNNIKEDIQDTLALTLARAAAIVYGQVLTQQEITTLLNNLFACVTPNYTPDGLTVLTIVTDEELGKLFARQ
ncbi:MAG: DNA mismatch repair endonuclease MutL [Mediterranea sp.]|jgi:DNA mismatch repair protein MutL|nr:DNA mismatch repair endonuclease MutL [Mediterranea sp.]